MVTALLFFLILHSSLPYHIVSGSSKKTWHTPTSTHLPERGGYGLDFRLAHALVTRTGGGYVAHAVWNLFLQEEAGAPETDTLHFTTFRTLHPGRVPNVANEHGSPPPAWENIGGPT